MWKTTVEKPVENVEKYEFSTGIPEIPNSVTGTKPMYSVVYKDLTGKKNRDYVAACVVALFAKESIKS